MEETHVAKKVCNNGASEDQQIRISTKKQEFIDLEDGKLRHIHLSSTGSAP